MRDVVLVCYLLTCQRHSFCGSRSAQSLTDIAVCVCNYWTGRWPVTRALCTETHTKPKSASKLGIVSRWRQRLWHGAVQPVNILCFGNYKMVVVVWYNVFIVTGDGEKIYFQIIHSLWNRRYIFSKSVTHTQMRARTHKHKQQIVSYKQWMVLTKYTSAEIYPSETSEAVPACPSGKGRPEAR